MRRPGAMAVLGGFTVLVYAFKLLPVLVIVLLAFNPPEFGSFPMTGLTLHWFTVLLDNPAIATAIRNSMALGALSAALSTVAGTAAAYAMTRYRFAGRAALQTLLALPLLVPHLILGVGLLLGFRLVGLSKSFGLMVAGHVALTLPFVVLTTQHRFQAIPAYLEEAARTLGSDGWQTFRAVTLPLAWPAIVSGLVFAFMSSFDEVTATLFWRPADFDTVPIYVLSELQNSVSQELNALAAALIVFSTAVPLATMLALSLFNHAADAGMSEPAIEIRAAEKWFGPVCAVKPFDLVVAEGAFVALLGSSGSGKTTMLRMVAGLETPTRGDILVKGRRVNDVPVHQRNFGMVFQNHALFPHKTAFDNVAFGLRYRGVAKAEIARRVRRALELVRLPQIEDRLPHQMSGGQQQRIAVARAIVIEPDLLLFDEPLSALDAGLREEMRTEIKQIQQSLGITTVFVTHDQAEALSMASQVVVMHDGEKQQEGTPEAIFAGPQSEFVMRFFGAVSEVDAHLAGGVDGVFRFSLGQGPEIALRLPGLAVGPQRFLLRAHELRLTRRAAEAASIGVPATIVGREYMGMLVRYHADIGGTVLQVLQPVDDEVFAVGQAALVLIPDRSWRVMR